MNWRKITELRKPRSRQPSLSEKQPPELIFFVDRPMANAKMVDVMRRVGYVLELHSDHFRDDEDDDVWIRVASEKGWIILTADKRVEKDHLECILASTARVILLIDNNSGWAYWTGALVAARERLLAKIGVETAPFTIRLAKDGSITQTRRKADLETARSQQIARSKRSRGHA